HNPAIGTLRLQVNDIGVRHLLVFLAVRPDKNVLRKQRSLSTAARIVVREGNVNRPDQVSLVERLGKVVSRKGLFGAVHRTAVGVVAQVDDRYRRTLHDLGGNGDAVKGAFQLDVHQ